MARFTTVDPDTGLPVRPTLYGANEQGARTKLVKALTERNDGRLVVRRGRAMTLQQWAERWLAARHRRPSTMKTDQEVLDLHILPALGRIRLLELRPVHIRGVMDAGLQEGRSPRTCNKIREVARKLLNAVNREQPGYLPFNAAELVEPVPHIAVKKQAILEPQQVHRLLERADEHRDIVKSCGSADDDREAFLGLRSRP
jgi:hypothetical protein